MTSVDELLERTELPEGIRTRLSYWASLMRQREQLDFTPICVVGEFSNGKSTFLNALVSAEGLLDSDVMPTTSASTVLSRALTWQVHAETYSGGERSWRWEGEDRSAAVREVRARLRACHEEFGEDLARLRVNAPFPGLPRKLDLIDTPGINSGDPDHQRRAREAILSSAGAVALLDAQYPGRAVDVSLLKELHRWAPNVAIVFNKSDLLDEEDLDELGQAAREMLQASSLGIGTPVLAVSSLSQFQGNNSPLSVSRLDTLLRTWRDMDGPDQRSSHLLRLARFALDEAATQLAEHVVEAEAEASRLATVTAEDPEEAASEARHRVESILRAEQRSLTEGYLDRFRETEKELVSHASAAVEGCMTSAGLVRCAEQRVEQARESMLRLTREIRSDFVRRVDTVAADAARERYGCSLPNLEKDLPRPEALVNMEALESAGRDVVSSVRKDVDRYLADCRERSETVNRRGGMGVWIALWLVLLFSGVGTPVAIGAFIAFKIFQGAGLRGIGGLLGFAIGALIGGATAAGGDGEPGAVLGAAFLGALLGAFGGYWLTAWILTASSRRAGAFLPLKAGALARTKEGIRRLRAQAEEAVTSQLVSPSGVSHSWVQKVSSSAAMAARSEAVASQERVQADRDVAAQRLAQLESLQALCREPQTA